MLKKCWALDESAVEPGLIHRLTGLLAKTEQWTAYEAAEFYEAFQPRRPRFVAQCIAEVEESQILLATVIACADSSRKQAAA